MRFFRSIAVAFGVISLLLGVLLFVAPPAGASSGASVASLAIANVGKKACSTNSLGGRYFGSSCTGNGGLPEYWCADFAKWVWKHSGVADTAWLSPAAGSFYTYGVRYGTLSATPAVGDAAVFDYDGGGVAAHVAIVVAVDPDGSIETVSGDWGGDGATEAKFSSTSSVVENTPSYLGAIGTVPEVMGMTLSGFVAPVGVALRPVTGVTLTAAPTTLISGESLSSPNDLYVLELEANGDLVEEAGSRVVWSTGTDDATDVGDWMTMQSDGNLVLYSATGQVLWSSGTSGYSGESVGLELSDNGTVSVVAGAQTLWSCHPATNVLAGGGELVAGEQLISSNGLYDLDMQRDGNLVEYTADRALWQARTNRHAGAIAAMENGGDVVIVSATGKLLWSTDTNKHAGATLSLSPSGELTVATAAGKTLWSRNPV